MIKYTNSLYECNKNRNYSNRNISASNSTLKNKKPLHIADQNHAHHRLLRRGYTQKQVVALIYAISILLSFIASMVLFLLVI